MKFTNNLFVLSLRCLFWNWTKSRKEDVGCQWEEQNSEFLIEICGTGYELKYLNGINLQKYLAYHIKISIRIEEKKKQINKSAKLSGRVLKYFSNLSEVTCNRRKYRAYWHKVKHLELYQNQFVLIIIMYLVTI